MTPPHISLHFLRIGSVTGSTPSHVCFEVGLGWFFSAYFSHSIPRGMVQAHKTEGIVMGNKGVGTQDARGRFTLN